MRTHILPLVIVAAFGAAAAAYASDTTTGTIQTFDISTHMLTLEDGTIYTLPGDFVDPGLKVGEKVEVVWDKKNNAGSTNEMRDVVSVTVVQ